jgi:uncharacterized protein YgiM (DUF1202 family)
MLTLVLFLSSVARASAGQDGAKPFAWLATVSNESAAVYAGVSDSSRVVTVLKQGDSVTINLEISSADGKWYAVSAGGYAGYMSGKALDVQERTVANWVYQPPPEPTPESAKDASSDIRDKAIAAASRARMQGDIKSFFVSKFGRTLPVSAFGQTRLHSRFGFDHRNSVDVALNPDSSEGRALLAKLRGFGVPFIAFRKAVPGIATGAHIHVGRPSPRK